MRYTMDSTFLTGCEFVDAQHGQLFDAINSLLEACEKGKGQGEVKKSLDFLSDYTVKHFFEEEQLLKKYGFSDLSSHHGYHEAFKKTVTNLAHEFILKGGSESLIEDVRNKIGTWLIDHIKGQDFRWTKELKARAPEIFTGKIPMPPARWSATPLPQTAPKAGIFSTPSALGETPHASPAALHGPYVMDSSFLTGCEFVDAQHGQLFDAINSLLGACGKDKEQLKKSLDFLSDYTVKHFFEEEQLLKKHGYSDLSNHHGYHETFKKTVSNLAHEFILKGSSESLIQDVEKKIGNWLIDHIKGQDFRWTKELKAKAPDIFSPLPVNAMRGEVSPLGRTSLYFTPSGGGARLTASAVNQNSPSSKAGSSGGPYIMDSSFLTGCEFVDTQHGQLFDAINSLLGACGKDKEQLKKSLDFLSDYTVKHFFEEEQLLKKHGYSDLSNHHGYHETFKKTVSNLAHEFILKGSSESLIQDVEKKIGNWLIDHIKGQDFRWTKELKAKAPEIFSGRSPPTLSAGTLSPASVSSGGKITGKTAQASPSLSSPALPKKPETSVPVLQKASEASQKKSLGILHKLTGLSSFLLFIVFFVMTLLSVKNMRELSLKTAVTVVESKLKGDLSTLKNLIAASHGELSLRNGRLTDENGEVLEGSYNIIDRISTELGVTTEIFERSGSGFRRVATSMMDKNGKQFEGFSMNTLNAAFEPLSRGESYTGEVIALERHFIGCYEPVFTGGKREVIGAVFVGMEMSKVEAIIDQGSRHFVLIAGLTAALLLAVSIALNFGILKILVINPVKKIVAVLQKAEIGDIGQQIKLKSRDEMGEIAFHVDKTLENMKRLVIIIQNEAEAVDDTGEDLSANMTKTAEAMNGISKSLEHIQQQVSAQSNSVKATNSAMEQITGNIDSLSNEIEIQSASVAQSSSAIEEMLANVDSVTRISRTNSENVNRLAEASEVGRTGLQAVAADMKGIAQESESLLEINAVLQNIASQTNLLAMNAAIEAAHAGEAGKGFAVVSDEIRKLAESSGTQSKTISTVLKKIKDSMTKISGATGEVLDKFEAIDSNVKTVSDQEEQIRNAMEEQNSGSRQILEAIEKLNEITRTVKNSSEEMREGSRAIITEGKNLEKITSEITGGMNEITERAKEIHASVNHVSNTSRRSGGNISTLKEAISQFSFTDNIFLWDDSLSIGVAKIDQQHKQLFTAVNDLISAIEQGKGREELKKALDFLTSYTATHFADEEKLQKECGYPDFQNHQRIHEAFKQMAQDLAREMVNGGASEILIKEVKRKFGDWLVTHIKGQDTKLGAYIRKIGFKAN